MLVMIDDPAGHLLGWAVVSDSGKSSRMQDADT